MKASYNGHLPLADLLIGAHADVNAKDVSSNLVSTVCINELKPIVYPNQLTALVCCPCVATLRLLIRLLDWLSDARLLLVSECK